MSAIRRWTRKLKIRKAFLLFPFLIILILLLWWKFDPQELWREYVDSRRKSDLESLDKILKSYIKYNLGGQISLGSVGVLYTSESGLNFTDGSGWIPVNFKASGLPLKELPLDPQNSAGFVFTYTTSPRLDYNLTARFESRLYKKYQISDNGENPDLYEIGTGLNLKP